MSKKITGRRQAREWVVQFLFQTEFNPEEVDEALDVFWSTDEKKPLAKWICCAARTFSKTVIFWKSSRF